MLLRKEIETRVKFNPGLSANRPSNNWAQVVKSKIKPPQHNTDYNYNKKSNRCMYGNITCWKLVKLDQIYSLRWKSNKVK